MWGEQLRPDHNILVTTRPHTFAIFATKPPTQWLDAATSHTSMCSNLSSYTLTQATLPRQSWSHSGLVPKRYRKRLCQFWYEVRPRPTLLEAPRRPMQSKPGDCDRLIDNLTSRKASVKGTEGVSGEPMAHKGNRAPRSKNHAPLLLGGSLVGVWNGWGYGIAVFRALNFQISEPEIWQKSLFLQGFRDFPANFSL